MASILVTGGAGYIGSVCVKQLIEQEHEVIILDNLSKGKKMLIHEKATFYEMDLKDENIKNVFSEHKIDLVMHFAGYKAVNESMEDAITYSDNITGTINLLNNMVKHEVKKIIFSSTAAVYGEPEYLPVDENHPTKTVNFYGYTKKTIEELLAWYNKIHGINYVVLRYFNVIGDVLNYVDPEAQNVLPIIMEVLAGKRKEFQILGNDYSTRDGTCIRDYIDINDLVQAHILALNIKESKIINLGSEKGVSVKELVDVVEKITRKIVSVKIAPRRKGDPAEVLASSKKAKKELGWEAKVPLEESIRTTLKAYKLI